MARYHENDKICLHPEDAISIRLWVDKLKSKNAQIFYKDKIDLPPPGSTLHQDVFVLCIQTAFQVDAFRRLGGGFIGIDATHNITNYQDLLLFTIVARDRWGHGKRHLLYFHFSGLRRSTKNRCSCCLDADIKRDIGNNFLFRCVGKVHQPSSPARYNHDRSRSGANCRTPCCLPKKPNIFVHVAHITRDSIAFRNNRIPRALG